MSAGNGHAREHALREMRQEIRGLARDGLSPDEIEQRLNGHRQLTEAEEGLIPVLTHHAVAEVKGHY